MIWLPSACSVTNCVLLPIATVYLGFRYDVDAFVGWGGVFREKFRPVDGDIQARPAKKADLQGSKKKVTEFTFLQHLLWHNIVVGPKDQCDIQYSLVGTNCVSWTIDAIIKARVISKMKI